MGKISDDTYHTIWVFTLKKMKSFPSLTLTVFYSLKHGGSAGCSMPCSYVFSRAGSRNQKISNLRALGTLKNRNSELRTSWTCQKCARTLNMENLKKNRTRTCSLFKSLLLQYTSNSSRESSAEHKLNTCQNQTMWTTSQSFKMLWQTIYWLGRQGVPPRGYAGQRATFSMTKTQF